MGPSGGGTVGGLYRLEVLIVMVVKEQVVVVSVQESHKVVRVGWGVDREGEGGRTYKVLLTCTAQPYKYLCIVDGCESFYLRRTPPCARPPHRCTIALFVIAVCKEGV